MKMPIIVLKKDVLMSSSGQRRIISHSPSVTHHGRVQLIFACLILAGVCGGCGMASTQPDRITTAFERHESDVRVEGEGVVTKLLADDRSGLAHQRFIIRLRSGQTVLIEHNIDIAQRLDDLRPGDTIGFAGEYVWNEQGGLVHWTHHDPAGKHSDGWLKHNGRTYQ
ncbi:MAG: DUF3465 domain-containing protein [Acidobacteriota bacterium]